MSDEDLRYAPPEDGYDWLAPLSPGSCLYVGEPRDDDLTELARHVGEVRTIEAKTWALILHRGTYAFEVGGRWHTIVVLAGLDPVGADSGRYRFARDGHLIVARSVHEDRWPDAGPAGRSVDGPPAFGDGDVVRVKDTPGFGRVRQVSRTPHGYRYRVDVDGVLRSYGPDDLVRVDGDPRDPEFWLAQPPASAAQLGLTLTWTKLRHPLTDTLYSFASSKTLFRAYQFTPVLKVLSGSAGRLLIADEVGLGKTIEAGLIWSELEQRMPIQRALVVTPSPLTLKWKSEMERRFDRRLRVLKKADLEEFADRLAGSADAELLGVVSLETLRTADEVLERLTDLQPRFDLIIVDEAHDLRNRGTKSHLVGSLLADWADYLIFLSATPLNLRSDDLFNLVSLLDEGTFGDRAVFEAQLEPNVILGDVARALVGTGRHDPRTLLARLDDLHGLQFGSAVTARPDFTILHDLLDTDRPLSHAEVAKGRRLLTDLNMLGGVLTRTRKVDVPNDKAIREPHNIDVEWTEDEREFYETARAWYLRRAAENGVPPGFATQMPLRQAASCIPAAQEVLRLKDPRLFREESDDVAEDVAAADLGGLDIAALTRPITVDTKYDRLLAELLRVRAAGLRQVMLFSFFRATLRYLARRLGEHFTVRVMDGTVSMDDRQHIMQDFRHGAFEILLLSQVGAEGLDFEFCNVLVNYDMPWNPMEVEQRIGRLDRFGQQHEKIFIYNMRVPGTVETDIFQRLYDRIDLFHNSIGELEPILREQIGDITRTLLDPKLDAEGRDEQIERMAVAAELRVHDIQRLEQSRGVLSGIDSMLVDGLTESGPGNGRFVGPTELHAVLVELLKRTHGQLRGPDEEGIYHLTGSRELAAALLSSNVPDGGSRHPRARLAAMLRDEEPMPVTLSAEAASGRDIDLLSSRHPLVKLALEVLSESSLVLRRFGRATVPALPAGRRYLVTVDLAATTGLRPLLELWATAVNVDTHEIDPDAGDVLLAALADGTLADAPPAEATLTDSDAAAATLDASSLDGDGLPHGLLGLWRLAHAAAQARRQATERERALDNEALIDGRILAQVKSIDLKITRSREIADGLGGIDASIRRLNDGRIRNLRVRRDSVPTALERNRRLTVSLEPVAVILVTGLPAEAGTANGLRHHGM